MIEDVSDTHGIVLRREAVAAGFTDQALRRLVTDGVLVRLRQGVYAQREVWANLSDPARHLLLARGVLRLYGHDVALSHQSAATAWGAPTWQVPLASVHLVNLRGVGERNGARVVHHRGRYPGAVERIRGLPVTSPAMSAAQTAMTLPRDPAIAVLDWFLHSKLASRTDLLSAADALIGWPGSLGLHHRIQLADGGSESVGETRARLVMRDERLPVPETAYEIRSPDGRLVAVADLALPEHRLLIEFDGEGKYLRDRRPGETIEQCVMREKQRENLIRRLTGFNIVRIVWSQLDHPIATAAMIRAAMLEPAA